MSDPNGGRESTSAAEHESIVSAEPEASASTSERLDIFSGDQDAETSARKVPPKTDGAPSDPISATQMLLPEGHDGKAVELAGLTTEEHDGNSHDIEASKRARDIEREASEHLARRAAGMTSRYDVQISSAESPTAVTPSKDALPASPPPPAPPRKDSLPVKAPQLEAEYDEKHPPADETRDDVPDAPQGTAEATGTEIQNIMDQFAEGMGGPGEQDIMTSLLERQQPMLVLPPRSSSLENADSFTLSRQSTGQSVPSPLSPQGTGNASISSRTRGASADHESIASSKAPSIFQPPPPSPDPEPALPFDFHRFLEQLRHRTADPVARFLRSFLNEFAKKQWMVHEQVKIISDFLEFIAKKMGQCEVWRTVSDAEFDNAREGMEKLVMNRLYSQTFSPAIPAPVGNLRKGPRAGRSQADVANPHGPGRRGQHQEDVERDDVIAQKIRIYGWIQEEHLDIKPVGDKGKKFLTLAQQELLKINTYRAPRDKVICVLNCCKVIFGFLRNAKADQSADAFVPLLIYTVLRAHPENLVSNVQYIWRFRNQDKLGGEAGYYMSSLMGVVAFIENLDRTNLTISDEDFERNVEQAVSAIAEKNRAEEYEEKTHVSGAAGPMQHLSEKSGLSRPEVTPRNSLDGERSSPRKPFNQRPAEKITQNNNNDDDDTDAVAGLLRTIQKPLNTIGRMFSDDASSSQRQTYNLKPASTPMSRSTSRGLSPSPQSGRRPSADGRLPRRSSTERHRSAHAENQVQEAAARKASTEAAEAQRVRVREHQVVVETLQSMFPNLDKDVIEDVVRSQEGNVGLAVDACLELNV